jgi:hypothetical protein
MRRTFLTLVAALVLTLSVAAGAAAKQDELGTPGEPNCYGQTNSFVASNGLKKLAKEDGLSQKEIKEIIEDFCTVP